MVDSFPPGDPRFAKSVAEVRYLSNSVHPYSNEAQGQQNGHEQARMAGLTHPTENVAEVWHFKDCDPAVLLAFAVALGFAFKRFRKGRMRASNY